MANKDRAVKSVSFKLTDPMEADLMEHAEKYPNFSAYVKRLIQRDKEGGWGGTSGAPAAALPPLPPPEAQETAAAKTFF